MENASYFISKALFILYIFVLTFFVKWENGLMKKQRLIPNLLTWQLCKETITIQTLPISRVKGNQTMKLGKLIEYNVRKIFYFQKSCKKTRLGRLD